MKKQVKTILILTVCVTWISVVVYMYFTNN